MASIGTEQDRIAYQMGMRKKKQFEKLLSGGVQPQSGAGTTTMPFGIEAQSSATMPSTVVADRPGMVSSSPVPPSNTRTIQSGVKGLAPDQIAGEIGNAVQDRRALAERLGVTYRAAQQAKMSGNIDEYNRLMDMWQNGVAERRDLETYGKNLSLTQPRQYVTPEQAAKSQAELPGMIARARQQSGSDALASLDSLPNASVSAGSNAVPASLLRPSVAPQDEIRRRGFLDFAGQEPTVGPDGNVTTLDAVEQAKRANMRAKIVADMNQPAPEAVPFDRAAYDQRMRDVQARSETASERAGAMVPQMQAATDFRRKFASGEQAVALADQERRKTAQDIPSLQARAALVRAQRDLANVQREPADRRADVDLNAFYTNILDGINGNSNAMDIANSALGNIEKSWDTLSEDQKLVIQNRLQTAMSDIEKAKPGALESSYQAIPGFVSPLSPLINLWNMITGKSGPEQRTSSIMDTQKRLRGLSMR